MKYDLEGPPPSRHHKGLHRKCTGKHHWVWRCHEFDGTDVYTCKFCGKEKRI